MKRTVYTLSLCLGILCFSCESKMKPGDEQYIKSYENKVISETSKKPVVTKKPDTIIDGKMIYNFGKENMQMKSITLNEAITEFEQGINNAKSCDDLIKACAQFDSRIKQLSKTNSNVSFAEVEKRSDVRAIRKLSEEKSLKMCQTQRIAK